MASSPRVSPQTRAAEQKTTPPWLRLREGGIELAIRLVPRASRDRVVGTYGDRLKISLTAPPVAGAANEALSKFLGKALRVAPSLVLVVRGARDRSKTILIQCADAPELAARAIRVLVPPR